jgi:hypothetical protein
MAEPNDQELYNKSKAEVDKSYDKPSAYRSMAYVRTYLKNYREKYGNTKDAYKGRKSSPGELKMWRKEKWIDIQSYLKDPKNPIACGSIERKPREYPLCMPIKDVKKYNKSELESLLKRKNEIGKRTLIKDKIVAPK